MASLRELQRSFAAALRDPAAACAVLPPANLAIYRNNAAAGFRDALQRTYPVVRRRVGDDYFRQLAAHYRERFPSRSGDLHWAGRDFAEFLSGHLDADYAWLADLARLEWARAECLVDVEQPSLGADELAGIPPTQFEHLVFGLQPSLRLFSSSYPVFTVWQANQVENAPPVSQSADSERGMIRVRYEFAEIRLLDAPLFSFIRALQQGSTLGEAMGIAMLDEHSLSDALAFLFREGHVCSLTVKKMDGGS